MQTDPKNLKQYFSHRVEVYNRFYGNTAGIFTRYWWRPLLEYKDATLEVLGDLTDKCVLEIGCGTGHLAVAMAKRGASVVAIDISPEMIQKAYQNAAQEGVADKILFITGNFLDLETSLEQQYDWVVVIAVFDYSLDPNHWLKIILSLSDKVIATFPSKNLFQVIIRHINSWFWSSFPLRFYTQAEVDQLLTKNGWGITFIKRLNSTYIIHASRLGALC